MVKNLIKSFSFLTKSNKKKRNPNIDFIRIIGMMAIIIHHLILHGGIKDKYIKFKNQLVLLDILCKWHVNSFGIISGLVNNKSHKFSNLLYLRVLVLFYSIILHLKYKNYEKGKYNIDLIKIIFPVIHQEYWYFTSYFGMYPFLNFINLGISYISSTEFKKSVYFIIGIFIIWSSYFQDKFAQNSGYSPISLIILYLIGAYMSRYIFNIKLSFLYRFLTSFICIALFIIVSISCYNININNFVPNNNSKLKGLFAIRINSFSMLLQVISITIFISNIKFNNNLSSMIIFIGSLTFDVYLIHYNPYIINIYLRTIFKYEKSYFKLKDIYSLIFKKCFFIFIICIFIAYIRNIIFTFFKIRKICFFLEHLITKILNYCI